MTESDSPVVQLPPARSAIPTIPGNPACTVATRSKLASLTERWDWSADTDGPADENGERWWDSLLSPPPSQPRRKIPSASLDEPAAPPLSAQISAERPADDTPPPSAPPPPVTSEVVMLPPPANPRRWMMPALVLGGAMAVALGGFASNLGADGSSAAASQQRQAQQTTTQQAARKLHQASDLTRWATAERSSVRASIEAHVAGSGSDQQPQRGQLMVTSRVACSEIWLDARARGGGNGRTFDIAPGAHAVGCQLPGGRMIVRRVVVAPGDTALAIMVR